MNLLKQMALWMLRDYSIIQNVTTSGGVIFLHSNKAYIENNVFNGTAVLAQNGLHVQFNHGKPRVERRYLEC